MENRLYERTIKFMQQNITGDVPNCWLQGKILPVPKKGDLSIASNY